MTHWILIADASGARIFSTTGRNVPLNLVREVPNPQGRSRNQELVSDEPGRLRKSGTAGTRSAMDPRTTAHDEAAIHFARDLATLLREALNENALTSLSVVAPAHFLGTLRPLLGKELEGRLRSSLPADLVHVRSEELRSHLEPLFVPGLFL